MSELRLANTPEMTENKTEAARPVDIHDRVIDAYFGKLGPQFMRETQQRIHWICGTVRGNRVLDVGCSQGIVPILLAREGRQIVGIDSDSLSIKESRDNIAGEAAHVQSNVSFVNADFVSHDFGAARFDTITLTEVLEHLVQPETFVEKSAALLNPGGRMIITVPFGVNDFVDHKSTYYLLEPYRMLARYCDVTEVRSLGKWLGLVGTRREAAHQVVPEHVDIELVAQLESAFLSSERQLRDEAGTIRGRLDDANTKYRSATEQITTLKQRIGQEEQQRKAAQQDVAEIKAQLDATEGKLKEQQKLDQQKISSLSDQLKSQQTEANETSKTNARLQTERDTLRERLDDANAKYRQVTEQYATLKERLGSAEAARTASDAIVKQLQAELRTSEDKYAATQTENQQKLQQLTQELNDQRAAVNKAEKDAIRSEAQAELFRERLENSTERLRVTEEQTVLLRERLAEQEAGRQSSLASVVHLQSQLTIAEQRIDEERARRRDEATRLQSELDAHQQKIALLSEQLGDHQGASVEAEKSLLRLQFERDSLQNRLEEANGKYRQSTELYAELKQRLGTAQASFAASEESVKQLNAQLAAGQQALALEKQLTEQERSRSENERTQRQAEVARLEGELDRQRQQADRLNEQMQAQYAASIDAEKALLNLQNERDGLRGRLDDANGKYRLVTEQSATLKQQVGAAQAELAQREQVLAELRSQLAAGEQALALEKQLTEQERSRSENERTQRQAEVARLEGELDRQRQQADRLNEQMQAQYAASIDAEKALLNLQNARDGLHVRLEEANGKYRLVTEQSATLKQQLGAAQTELAQREQALAEQQAQLVAGEQALVEEKQRGEQALAEEKQLGEQARLQIDRERDARLAEVARLGGELTQQREHFAALNSQLESAQLAVGEAANRLDALAAESQTLTARLTDANTKYRLVTQQYAELRDRLQKIEADRDDKEFAAAELQAQLAAERSEHAATEEKLGKAASEANTLAALRREQEHQLEQLRLQALKAAQRSKESEALAEQLRQQKLAAEYQIVKTRATLSFQLGYKLVHGFKSWRAIRELPRGLWELRQESVRRRKAREAGSPVPATQRQALLPGAGRAANLPTVRWTPPALDSSTASAADLKQLKVAGIMDEFTFTSYQAECNLLQLTPQYWQRELEDFKPKLLFIESAWRGKDDLWGSKVGHMSQELQGIVAWCRKNKVPTVFWNKEDPVHFETFLSTAKLFDYVFTTDIDCIHRYKGGLGHDRVFLLPFAAQPALSNPVETYERKDAFCFAGAYYVRYPERTRDLGNFVSELAGFRPVEIYDRNFGKNDPNYQFPPEYQPFIVGNLPFEQIDKAYKGYNYAINLNSIKQSQTMFARRVFELLASNTITVSNFSRGVRLLFGDLVVTTDSGKEIVRRLGELGDDQSKVRKFRLAALRKVMSEHTYQDRLAYVAAKVRGAAVPDLLPPIVVTTYAKTQEQFDTLLAHFRRQNYAHKRLCVVVPGGTTLANVPEDDSIRIWPAPEIQDQAIAQLLEGVNWIAGMVPDDYYGPNYLLDLALATRYSTVPVVGKVGYHVWSATGGLSLANDGRQYHPARSIAARSALVSTDQLATQSLREWVIGLYTRHLEADGLSIDEFNYCRNANTASFDETQQQAVNDLASLDVGISLPELIARAERIPPEEACQDDAPLWSGEKLASMFNASSNPNISLEVRGAVWNVRSSLPDGKHEYLYAHTDLRPADLGFNRQARLHFDVAPGLNLQLVMLFLDAQKQRIGNVVKAANRNQDAEIPAGTEWIRLGIRVYSGGAADIRALVLGHRPLRPSEVVGRAEHLVLTNHYPSYDDLYRNGFVHSRVAAYRERGVKAEVFRLRPAEALTYHEFHDVDVITGSQEALHKLLGGGRYKSVLVHFLDESMWQVLQRYTDRMKLFVWVHGAEIQPWHRRDYNFKNEQERDAAKVVSDKRMTFWRKLLQPLPKNFHPIFVSRYFAEEVMEDLGFRLPDGGYSIIHNPIDTDLFAYHPKPAEQRKKVLSIRPYASATYANDLSVKAIIELAKQPFFNDLEFRMIGDGPLFDEILEPLRQFKNVYIERRFLTRSDIAELHRTHGVFLCPSRMDTQGVSRDEAMSSGLVPVTNAVAAIPEFVDETCGLAVAGEDWRAMAVAIARLYSEPEGFLRLSRAASLRIKKQSAMSKLIGVELNLFSDK